MEVRGGRVGGGLRGSGPVCVLTSRLCGSPGAGESEALDL